MAKKRLILQKPRKNARRYVRRAKPKREQEATVNQYDGQANMVTQAFGEQNEPRFDLSLDLDAAGIRL